MDNENTSTHLDKLLEGKPPEFQNKVLRFAYDSGMKPNDPAFQFVQYVGFFAAIAENAPHEWRNLFNDVYQYFQQLFDKQYAELNKWTDLTEEQLKNFHRQTETIKNLAESCNQLANSLRNLEEISKQQIEQSRNFEEISADLKIIKSEMPKLEKISTELKDCISPFVEAILMEDPAVTASRLDLNFEEMLDLTRNPEKRPTLLPLQAKQQFLNEVSNQISETIKPILTQGLPDQVLEKIKPLLSHENKAKPTRIWNCEPTSIAILVVAILGFLVVGCFSGMGIRSLQLRADRDYRLAMEILDWNRDQLQKARAEGKEKTTVWIVPEHEREKK